VPDPHDARQPQQIGVLAVLGVDGPLVSLPPVRLIPAPSTSRDQAFGVSVAVGGGALADPAGEGSVLGAADPGLDFFGATGVRRWVHRSSGRRRRRVGGVAGLEFAGPGESGVAVYEV
jgi:hypothetical protein